MAEEKPNTPQEEDLIILKDGEESFEETSEEQVVVQKPSLVERFKTVWDSNKDKIFNHKVAFVVATLSMFFLINIFFDFVEKKSFQKEQIKSPSEEITKTLKEKEIIKKDLLSSDIKRLVTKATLLYERGDKEESLDLFHKIAVHNESLSWYNLGVARMKDKSYLQALQAFTNSLKTKEHRFEASLNAAVCSLFLNNMDDFKYYIDLADAYLSDEISSPLYSYYFSLINYYKNRPFEVLAGNINEVLNEYEYDKNRIAAKAFLLFNDTKGVIDHVEQSRGAEDFHTLGLLYSRAGDYTKAIERLKSSIEMKMDNNETKEALILAYLKSGEYQNGAILLKSMLDEKKQLGAFPIKLKLKERLFDIDLAQEYFKKSMLLDKEAFLGMLFFFTPYQKLNPDKTLTLIKKGETTLNANDVLLADDYLKTSILISNTNANSTLAIKLALNNRILEANKIFLSLEQKYNFHDVLEYNLALSYAQLGDYKSSYRHFKRAYFLNTANKMAGVFAVITSSFAMGNEDRSLKELMEEFSKKNDDESFFYLTLLNFYNENYQALSRWIDEPKLNDPRYLVLNIFASDRLEKYDKLKESSKKLVDNYPKELLSNLLDIYADNKKLSVKKQAFGLQDLIVSELYDKNTLFYGPPIVRELFIKLGLLTGNLPKIKEMYKKRLAVETLLTTTLVEGLALTGIYLKDFEEAFVLYNQLIDEHKKDDTKTLLLASISAIGSSHKENAIALLELARIKDKQNYEARLGLGLLYHEIGNYDGASVQYSFINNKDYVSKYYDFELAQ